MKLNYYLCLIFLCFTGFVSGQEYHWTMYRMSPLTVNPAQTGDFYGSVRVGGIYRNQYAGISSKAFSTPSFYVDAPIVKGFRDQDWVGVGTVFFTDKAGFLGLKNTGFLFSAAYHLSLDKKQKSVLTLGFQSGSFSRKLDALDPSAQIFGDELPQGSPGLSIDRNRINQNGSNATEYAGGIKLKTEFGNQTKFDVGFRVGHISKMNLAVAGGFAQLSKRYTGHASLDFIARPGLRIIPSMIYDNLDPAGEIAVQTMARLLVDPEKEMDFAAGLGYRLGDAAQVLLGVNIGDIQVGAAFDITLSDLSEGSYFGGFELAASYIIKIYKEPEVDPVIFCPRF